MNEQASKLWILRQLATIPACKPFEGANPQTSVTRRKQASNIVGWQVLIWWRLPLSCPDSVEANQTELRAKPEITVGRLGNRVDRTFGKTVANLPGRVRVLADVKRRVQCGGKGATRQENAQGHRGGCLSTLSPHVDI